MTARKIFLAGAAGAVGARLAPLLVKAGHDVTGTTRSAAKAAMLRGLGVRPAVVDVFDLAALRDALGAAHPEIVIHQLTDLPRVSTRRRWARRSRVTPASAPRARATWSRPPWPRARAASSPRASPGRTPPAPNPTPNPTPWTATRRVIAASRCAG